MDGLVVWSWLLILTIASEQATCLVCLRCNNIAQPHLCTRVVHCNDGDVCIAERFVNDLGKIEYDLGCYPKEDCYSVSTTGQDRGCLQCCSSDLCTNDACGEPGYGSLEGQICYDCTQETPFGQCHDISFCTRDQMCYVYGKSSFGQMVYISQCMSKNVCEVHQTVGSLVGRRHFESSLSDEHAKRSDEVHECDTCCSTHLCNSKCSKTVDGSWGEWGEWSQCSWLCDNGTQTRDRSCDTHSHSGGGANCTGTYFQSQECAHFNCPADCSDLVKNSRSWPSGVYRVATWLTHKQVDVFCDMDTDGGGWTVFQHRVNGSVDFYRNFSNYEDGFGSLHGEFWLGLRLLNELTSRRNNTLRVDLQAPDGTKLYDVYERFSVGPGSNYRIHLGKRTNSLNLESGDLLISMHDGQAFTTYDHDRDNFRTNCAVDYHGAWWYSACYMANLNGQYVMPGIKNAAGMTYNLFEFEVSLKESKMMFK